MQFPNLSLRSPTGRFFVFKVVVCKCNTHTAMKFLFTCGLIRANNGAELFLQKNIYRDKSL